MINQKTIAILPNPENITTTVIGTGAVGSKVVNELTRLGLLYMIIWDNDIVEEKNIGNQAFIYSDIGKSKVQATKELAHRANPEASVTCINHTFTDMSDINTKYVFITVDSMKARKDIFDVILEQASMSGETIIGIDTRIAAYECSVYSFSTDNEKSCTDYKKTLYDDSKVAKEFASACGEIQGLGTLSSLAALCAVQKMIHSENNNIEYGEDILNIEKGFHAIHF